MMQKSRSGDYFKRRAEEERAASERAADTRAARSHRELAEQFRKLAAQGGKPTPVSDTDEPTSLREDFRILW